MHSESEALLFFSSTRWLLIQFFRGPPFPIANPPPRLTPWESGSFHQSLNNFDEIVMLIKAGESY